MTLACLDTHLVCLLTVYQHVKGPKIQNLFPVVLLCQPHSNSTPLLQMDIRLQLFSFNRLQMLNDTEHLPYLGKSKTFSKTPTQKY